MKGEGEGWSQKGTRGRQGFTKGFRRGTARVNQNKRGRKLRSTNGKGETNDPVKEKKNSGGGKKKKSMSPKLNWEGGEAR